MTLAAPPDTASLRALVDGRQWYHTLELAPGVVTPGWFDLRGVVDRVPLPPSLRGLRCLDVGTFEGFWAFELERRGAAEVLAADILDPLAWDWPVGSDRAVIDDLEERKDGGRGFRIAAGALGSRVQHVERSIYDLDPGDLGTFDVVYVGSLLLHLRDPVRALEAVRSVCRGRLVAVDAVDPLTSLVRRPLATLDGVGRPWWWLPNVAAFRRLVEAAGFTVVEGPTRLRLPRGAGQPVPAPRALRHRDGRRSFVAARIGDPHAALAAVPR
jgi:tRNA (mo5U34)-methyltransferase